MNWLSCFVCKKKTPENIRTLDFNRSSLKEVPPEIFNFERTLENLYLDGNKITELPRTLFHCEELRNLDLSDNEIQSLPTLISKLINLQILNISRNCLKYSDIPNNIHRCQKLTVLDLSSNILEKVPESLTSLVNLHELYLNDTYIEFLPANFGRLSNLRILELRDNNLTTLPKSLRRLTALRRLDISNNDFSEMPEAICQMTNLKELWINGNCFVEIDKNISNLLSLVDFDASKNDIDILPPEIGSCTKLQSLILSNNLLKEFPSVCCKLEQLQTLKLDFNCLKSLPPNLGDLVNLEELDVQNNQLSTLPNSIGFLRKLNYLVLSHNFLSTLPSEIGSCISLTIINVHNNMLKKLPEEIGHLQKLTSLGLIGNKLEYLPIPLANLPHLRALWLTQNQSHPLIPLQTEKLDSSGQLVLTCFLLPQIHLPPEVPKIIETSVPSTKRHICFNEQGLPPEQPARLTRAPTPYPKDLQRYQRYLNNQLRRTRDVVTPNVNSDQYISEIREAKVTPMKIDEEEACYYEKIQDKNIDNYNITSETSVENRSVVHNNTDRLYDRSKIENTYNSDYASDRYDTVDNISDGFVEFTEGKKRPPPYHIAAAYSKNAHFFNNLDQVNGSMDKTKNFTDELSKNTTSVHKSIHFSKRINSDEKYNVDDFSQRFTNSTYDEDVNHRDKQENLQNREKSPLLLHIDLTPCCYVLGFSVTYNENGVFISKVDENGNAYQKLFPGDQLLMLNKQDLTKLDPFLAYKTVLIQGPEAESFFISRS